jgi:hypothetical protein
MGGQKSFGPKIRGVKKVLGPLRGGGSKKFRVHKERGGSNKFLNLKNKFSSLPHQGISEHSLITRN